jgi:hypothetical protein
MIPKGGVDGEEEGGAWLKPVFKARTDMNITIPALRIIDR